MREGTGGGEGDVKQITTTTKKRGGALLRSFKRLFITVVPLSGSMPVSTGATRPMPNPFIGIDVEKWAIMKSHRQNGGNQRRGLDV